jgi:hypothetical protein
MAARRTENHLLLMNTLRFIVLSLSTAYACAAATGPERLAFPGAEGFGRFAKGGRGGDVYHVTNLNDAGPGSLREGINNAIGPRTIVFDVAGNIWLQSPLRLKDKAFLTLAGQTAPGDGITVCNQNVSLANCHDIIIRYLRLRLGDRDKAKGGVDTLTTDDIDRVILDHVSLSWAIDGTHDLRRGGNFTLQWCLMGEALHRSIHEKGPHAMLASYRNPTGNMTLHHNIFTTSRDRHPTLGAGGKDKANTGHLVDFRNNVIYNWSKGGTSNFGDNMIVAINNVWRPGPESDPKFQPISIKGDQPAAACGFMSGNIFDGRDDWTRDNYAALNFKKWRDRYAYRGTLAQWKKDPPDLGQNAPMTQPAKEAMELVLQFAGASLHRDAVDARLVKDIRNRTGKLIDSQNHVGGWPELKSAAAPADTDGDGMPDAWEAAHGLDPENPADRNGEPNGGGYTNLEESLNSLVPTLPAGS